MTYIMTSETRQLLADAIEATGDLCSHGRPRASSILNALEPVLETIETNAYQRGRASTLRAMQDEVREINIDNGWYEELRTFGESIALLHSEASEALEAYRQWGLADRTPKLTAASVNVPKPEGVGSEFADILIRLLDDCHRYHVDLAFEFQRKLAYNSTRGYRHGGKKL